MGFDFCSPDRAAEACALVSRTSHQLFTVLLAFLVLLSEGEGLEQPARPAQREASSQLQLRSTRCEPALDRCDSMRGKLGLSAPLHR